LTGPQDSIDTVHERNGTGALEQLAGLGQVSGSFVGAAALQQTTAPRFVGLPELQGRPQRLSHRRTLHDKLLSLPPPPLPPAAQGGRSQSRRAEMRSPSREPKRFAREGINL
jgi:hypothetical protein